MSKHTVSAVVLAALLPLLACDDDGVADPVTNTGTYELQSVNGGLPWDTTVSLVGITITYEVRAGSLILQEDGTYRSLTALRATTDGDTEEAFLEETGLYTWSGESLFLNPDGEVVIKTGTRGGDEIRFEAEDVPNDLIGVGVWIYRR